MDLLDLESDALYFERPLAPNAERALMQAASAQGTPAAELHLLRAFLLAPDHLAVLLALYRYYVLADRLDEAASVADRCVRTAGEALGFPADWRQLNARFLMRGVGHSFGRVRFYLLALKARACIGLRRKELESSRDMLMKIHELDDADRLGTVALIAIVDNRATLAERGGHP